MTWYRRKDRRHEIVSVLARRRHSRRRDLQPPQRALTGCHARGHSRGCRHPARRADDPRRETDDGRQHAHSSLATSEMLVAYVRPAARARDRDDFNHRYHGEAFMTNAARDPILHAGTTE